MLGLAALGLAALAAPFTAGAQATAADTRPTVAVLYFTNGAIGRLEEYAPLSQTMADALITELTANTGIRVVERARVQALFEEQNLAAGGRIEPATATGMGKTLGALHMVTGAFLIDARQNMRIDLRVFNTETSLVEYVTTVNGKADRLMELLTTLGAQVTQGLKLPPLPTGVTPGSGIGATGPNQLLTAQLLGRAMKQIDLKKNPEAVALLREVLRVSPGNPRAEVLLASLEGGRR